MSAATALAATLLLAGASEGRSTPIIQRPSEGSQATTLIRTSISQEGSITERDAAVSATFTALGLLPPIGRRTTALSSNDQFVAYLDDGCRSGGGLDLFLRDLATGARTRVNVDRFDGCADQGAFAPSISADGALIAFESRAGDLGCAVSADHSGVFVRDLRRATTSCVSFSGENSGAPALSADGQVIAFQAFQASRAVSAFQVFIVEVLAGGRTLISHAPDGAPGDGASQHPVLSADGHIVAFESVATNLERHCRNGRRHIFVHDRNTPRTTCISTAPGGTAGDGDSASASISADGQRVIFESSATNLDLACANGRRHVFVHDRTTGATRCVSLGARGAAGDGNSGAPIISGDGLTVLFTTLSRNLPGLASVQGSAVVQVDLPVQLPAEARGRPGHARALFPSPKAFECLLTNTCRDPGNPCIGKKTRCGDTPNGPFVDNPPSDNPGDPDPDDPTPSVQSQFVAPQSPIALPLDQPTPLTFSWIDIGTPGYFFEVTRSNAGFANPNGRMRDTGAIGGLPVNDTTLQVTVVPSLRPGVYRARIIGAQENGDFVGTFSDPVTVLLGLPVDARISQLRINGCAGPLCDPPLRRGGPIELSWVGIEGLTDYFIEVSGPGHVFANPNGQIPDSVNGFGGAGRGFLVTGTAAGGTVPEDFPPGRYQVRVIGRVDDQPVARFSDALEVSVD
jgi:Tol biopolymer transport system component